MMFTELAPMMFTELVKKMIEVFLQRHLQKEGTFKVLGQVEEVGQVRLLLLKRGILVEGVFDLASWLTQKEPRKMEQLDSERMVELGLLGIERLSFKEMEQRWGKVLKPESKQIKAKASKEPFADKLIAFLPEDYRGELQALRERWIKRNYSPQRIKWLTYKHIFLGFLCLIQVNLENLRLPKYGASKEIE